MNNKDTLRSPGKHTNDLYYGPTPYYFEVRKGVINIPSHHTILRSVTNK